MTFVEVPSPAIAVTNMPGLSRASGLAKVAWIWTLRVAGSMTESVAVSLPAASVLAFSAFTRTTIPVLRRVASCCGTEKFT